jgi:mono/diheme cytochrome c family protein
LPQFAHPALSSRHLRRATTDGLFISIEARDAKFELSATRALLESAGATAIEICYEQSEGMRMPRLLKLGGVVAILLSCIPPLCIALAREVKSGTPRIDLIPDMNFQPKYKSQQASGLFADGRAMRPPVPGTVAAGALQENDHWYRGKVGGQPATTFPLPVTESVMHRGQLQFNTFCAPCHGLTGAGNGPIAEREQQRKFRRLDPDWVPPLSLHNPTVVDQPVGKLFATITAGVRTMPAYGAQIAVEDRWAIIAYVRALQRSEKQ